MRRSYANFKFKKINIKKLKLIIQTRKWETITNSNKKQLYINQIHVSYNFQNFIACLKLFRNMNDITFKLPCDAICKVQCKEISKQIKF